MNHDDPRMDEHARRANDALARALARSLYFHHRTLIEGPLDERPPCDALPASDPLLDRFHETIVEVERLPDGSLRPFVESLVFAMNLDLFGWRHRLTEPRNEPPHPQGVDSRRVSEVRQRVAEARRAPDRQP